jgi:hypothetical protein
LISLVPLLGSLACSDPEQDAGCPSNDGEFALAGCAVLVGQVYGNLGQPLSAISVSFRALRPCSCTEFGNNVDTQGRFSFTVNRFDEDGAGDTLSVIVRAVATGQQYPQPTPTTFIGDSVEGLLTFRAVGALPDTTIVDITLPIP